MCSLTFRLFSALSWEEQLVAGELQVEHLSIFLCLVWVYRLDGLRDRLQGIKMQQKMQKK